MKKNFLKPLLFAATLATAFSCADPELDDPNGGGQEAEKEYAYTFGLSDAAYTKVAMDDAAFSLEDGDEIGVVALTSEKNVLASAEVEEGEFTFAFMSKNGLQKGDKVFAYYPMVESEQNAPSRAKLTIPNEQNQTEDSYDASAMPLISEAYVLTAAPSAEGQVGELSMKPLGAIMQFNIYSTAPGFVDQKIEWVKFTSPRIAGDFTWDFTAAEAPEELSLVKGIVTTNLETEDFVAADAENAANVFMVVAPGAHEGTVEIRTDAAKYTYNMSETDLSSGVLTEIDIDLNETEWSIPREYTYKFAVTEEMTLAQMPASLGFFAGATSAEIEPVEGAFTYMVEDYAYPVGTGFAVYYPGVSAEDADPAAVALSIPAEQTNAAEGGYNAAYMPLVAAPLTLAADYTVNSDENVGTFALNNLAAGVKFNVYSAYSSYTAEKLVSLTFNAEGVAGSFTWDLTAPRGADEAWTPACTGSSVKVTPAESLAIGADAENAASVYAVVANGTFEGTLKVVTTQADYTIPVAETVFARDAETVVNVDLSTSTAVKLTADVDLAGKTFVPVDELNTVVDGSKDAESTYAIKNWTSSTTLFKKIARGAVLKNLTIDASCKLTVPAAETSFEVTQTTKEPNGDTKGTVTVYNNMGFVANRNEGTLSCITNNANVNVAGLVSDKISVDATSYNLGYNIYIANICGVNTGTVSNCTNNGSLTYSGAHVEKNTYFGGIIGNHTGASAVASGCTNNGKVSVTYSSILTHSSYISGMIGWSTNAAAQITNCTNGANGAITVKAPGSKNMIAATGIVNYTEGAVTGCTNNAAISYYAESSEGAANGGVQRVAVAGVGGVVGNKTTAKTSSDNHNTGAITFRGGYHLGNGGCGAITKFATNVAGVFGAVANTTVSGCTNSGVITSVLADIDNASSNYQTTSRQSCAGVVASNWGPVTNCTNNETGIINATYTISLPVSGTARSALSKNCVVQVGGVAGGSYNGDTASSSYTNCVNKAPVNYICDSSGSNNSIGGVVGWPHAEAVGGKLASQCRNEGNITVDGYGKHRIGGISGGSIKQSQNTNIGTVYLKGGQASCSLGGISGYLRLSETIEGCLSTGTVKSDIKLAGTQGSDSGGIGGIVGSIANAATAVNGCEINCAIIAPEGSTAFLVAGVVGQNKSTSTKVTLGTDEHPNIIKGGSITLGTTTTQVSSSNFNTLSLPWDTSKTNAENTLPNANISYVVNFQAPAAN